MPTPESLARQQIDQLLAASGWTVQDRAGINLDATRGVARVRGGDGVEAGGEAEVTEGSR